MCPATVLRYLPLDGRPARTTLGLRPLDLDHWLEADGDRRSDLATKRRLLADRHHDVVAHLPSGAVGAAETLRTVRQWLSERTTRTDVRVDPDLHPIDAAGRLVQEDLCLLGREGSAWVLTAASVCFPSRWRLADTIGRPVRTIHDPVPGYEKIATAVDRSLDRLTVDRPRWRLNWTIVPSPDLFLSPDEPARRQEYPGLSGLWLRVERQTLRRLPVTDTILFTIRTYRASLADLLAKPDAAAAALDTLRSVDPEHADYQGWLDVRAPLLADLEDTLRRAGRDTREPLGPARPGRPG